MPAARPYDRRWLSGQHHNGLTPRLVLTARAAYIRRLQRPVRPLAQRHAAPRAAWLCTAASHAESRRSHSRRELPLHPCCPAKARHQCVRREPLSSLPSLSFTPSKMLTVGHGHLQRQPAQTTCPSSRLCSPRNAWRSCTYDQSTCQAAETSVSRRCDRATSVTTLYSSGCAPRALTRTPPRCTT